ncbi:MAG: YafY family transcriptional regulator [Acidobacteria bacterium]|nr:YafY family transcriptional regulator [Acidobacteriota bacterium]MCB9378355.1 YafY family transcriptional regulator [Holophagales bacterium]
MRRADRLFRLLFELRRGRVTTAARLAERLEVSERTIYRDVADLSASGVPIEGEAGVGYRLRGFELPPLMFGREEIEALVLGARVVESWGDGELAVAAREALAKIEAVLPRRHAHLVEETRLYAPSHGERPAERLPLASLRHAIRERRRVFLRYRDASGRETERSVRPLALAFYPPVWLLLGWCELRDDFRNFRLDRCLEIEERGGAFEPEPGKRLEDYLGRHGDAGE